MSKAVSSNKLIMDWLAGKNIVVSNATKDRLSMGHRLSRAVHREVKEARRRRDGFSELQ